MTELGIAAAVLFALGHHGAAVLYAGLAIVLWLKHHENIRRLLAGKESKVGAKS